MELLNLSKRATHQYNTGWASLDDWLDVGTVKSLAPQLVRNDDCTQYVQRIVAPAALRGCNLSRAINDTLTTGCTCEYDCCGCSTVYADAVRVSAREYSVKITISRNI